MSDEAVAKLVWMAFCFGAIAGALLIVLVDWLGDLLGKLAARK